MKTFRLIGMALLAILITVNFIACSDDEEEEKDLDFIGTWEGRFTYPGGDYQILTLTFTADGKYTKKRVEHEDGEDYSDTVIGTYTYDDDRKYLEASFKKIDGETSSDEYYVKSVSATTLVLIDWIDWEYGDETGGDTFIRK